MGDVVGDLVERRWPGRVRSVEPLANGITNTNFVVDLGDEKLVVRVPGRDTDLLGVNRANEVLVGRLVAGIGVGPEVVDLDEATGCLITRFIESRPVSPEEIAREPMLGEFVATLRRVHAAGPVAAHWDVERVTRVNREAAAARGVVAPFDAERAFAVVERIFEVRPFRPTVLGHNDLLNANFLYDGRLRIVDWEYAGMADPFFDLANVAVNNGFSPDAERRLLGLYFGGVDDALLATMHLMKIVSQMREAMWGVVQMAISSLDVDFAAYASERGTHALALADEGDLDGRLALAAALVRRQP